MSDILVIHKIEITFTEGKIMDSIEKIGFPCSVIAYETVDLVRKLQGSFRIILEIGDR